MHEFLRQSTGLIDVVSPGETGVVLSLMPVGQIRAFSIEWDVKWSSSDHRQILKKLRNPLFCEEVRQGSCLRLLPASKPAWR
jgi:hypothetical protein